MTDLTSAHQGYEYQDLMTAIRLVDVMLEPDMGIHIDEKQVPDDRFDDLITEDGTGQRECVQFKFTRDADQPLTLATFTQDLRRLKLDRVFAAAMAHRRMPGCRSDMLSFRIVLPDALPSDPRLRSVLEEANTDSSPFAPGMDSVRMRFRADALWGESEDSTDEPPNCNGPFSFLRNGDRAVGRQDLDWVCERLVIELIAPPASRDLTKPGEAERLLLDRVRNEVGAGRYPNADRSAIGVAEALIGCARAGRQGSIIVTRSELLRRTRLRSDFGAVSRAYPVDSSIEVPRISIVAKLKEHVTTASNEGKPFLLVGPPGQGKSWICQRLFQKLSDEGWLVAEHYCFLGDADGERDRRVDGETIFGSLLGRIKEHNPDVVSQKRPQLVADKQALEETLAELRRSTDCPVALVVDGIDHVTRVIGRAGDSDPSLALAKALANLQLPSSCILIVLSQPGEHLDPLETTGAATFAVPPLTDAELRQLATNLGVFPDKPHGCRSPNSVAPHDDEEAADEFLAALSERSAGNALYATYLCREVTGKATPIVGWAKVIRDLPQFDNTLHAYYQYIQDTLGDKGGWVADVIALLDFPVSAKELKEIHPDSAHRVDAAIKVLRPVLSHLATEGGIRIYHESFARLLREPYQEDPAAMRATLDGIIKWLEAKGIFDDSRVYRHLLPILSEVGNDQRVVSLIDREFVVKSIACGFPASAIIRNVAMAIGSATRTGNWPAVARYVEMSRSIEAYQETRLDASVVNFVDVAVWILGRDRVAEGLLHEGRPTMAAQFGLQMCAALDALGVAAPWHEYMRAFRREQERRDTSYHEVSDQEVRVPYLRGRLRLASAARSTLPDTYHGSAITSTESDADSDLNGPVEIERVAAWIDGQNLPAADVISAILDTLGLPAVVELIDKLAHPGIFCLLLAERIVDGSLSITNGDAMSWALRAVKHGLPPGNIWRLIPIGMGVDQIDSRSTVTARKRLLDLTRKVQDSSIQLENRPLNEWMDACAVAAIADDQLALSASEALLCSPGWYTCWLRFAHSLAVAETLPKAERQSAGLDAIRILTEVKDPFSGEPRACDLYWIHDLIDTTIRRAVSLLEGDEFWEQGIMYLGRISEDISTTMDGEIGGPVPIDRLLHLVVETATPGRQRAAQAFLDKALASGTSGMYYADLAKHRLVSARLALNMNDRNRAKRHWMDACRLLTAYGWHKDITIFELLDPLPALVTVDPIRGRKAIARLQPLCDRVFRHTDERETRHAPGMWWKLLAEADPCALANLIQTELLNTCNDPNWLLHDARTELWTRWHHRAEPIISGVLRMTLDTPLDVNDPNSLDLIANASAGKGHGALAGLLSALIARADERPIDYLFGNADDSLGRDRMLVEELNRIARRQGMPKIGSSHLVQAKPYNEVASNSFRSTLRSVGQLSDPVVFTCGSPGIEDAIRALRVRGFYETHPDWSVERFANVLGYRILELMEADRERDAETIVGVIANAAMFDFRNELLNTLADGFDRHGKSSLAATTYTLAWILAWSRSDRVAFVGETEIDSLQNAIRLDRPCAEKIVGEEISRFVSAGVVVNGASRALIYGCLKGNLGGLSSASFDVWEEAYAVIAERIPRVASSIDPEYVYVPPAPDDGTNPPGDIDAAFAVAAVAGIAHPVREAKRRALAAVQLLIDQRATAAAAALESALSSLSDPATLTWLLRVIELAGTKATPIVRASRNILMKLAQGPHLTVRVIARRLLANDEIPASRVDKPDPELLDRGVTGILLPVNYTATQEQSTPVSALVDVPAGNRLARGRSLLPGLRQATLRRVDVALKTDEIRDRMRRQLQMYRNSRKGYIPDVFMARHEAVEDAMQRSAAGIRAARLMNHEPVAEPKEIEERLAQALMDDPALPLALEWTRQPRPEIPPPPLRDDPIWLRLLADAKGRGANEVDIESVCQEGSSPFGTTAILNTGSVPTLIGGPYDGWRLAAAAERRKVLPPRFGEGEPETAERYMSIELRLNGDRQALAIRPFVDCSIEAWHQRPWKYLHPDSDIRTGPIVGLDYMVHGAGDGHHGLGIQQRLVTPTPWISTVLKLRNGTKRFVLKDDSGPVVALITWRAEYDTTDSDFTIPRLHGAGLVVRNDAMDKMIHAARGNLIFRDFICRIIT